MSTSTWSMRVAKAAAVRKSMALRAPIAIEQPGWESKMICLGLPPSVFFGTHPRSAREICAQCPVQMSCLARANAEEAGAHWKDCFGIRAGLTPRERWDGRRAPENRGQLCLV